MKSPFPGMDPYLEHPALWPDVNNSLIIAIRDEIAPLVAPRYYVGVESRAYVVKPEGDFFLGRPDVAVAAAVYTQPTPAAPMAEEAGVLEVELPVGDEINH